MTKCLPPPGSGKSQMNHSIFQLHNEDGHSIDERMHHISSEVRGSAEWDYLEAHREVYQVEVKVLQLQCSEALLACYLNQGPLMKCVPQLWKESKCNHDPTASTVQTRGQKPLRWWSRSTTPSPPTQCTLNGCKFTGCQYFHSKVGQRYPK